MKAPPGRFLRLLLPLCCLAISFPRAQSSSPPPATDTDGDGVPDKHDGWPRHKQLKTPPVPDSQYVVIDLGPGVAWGLNKHGDVVGFSSNNRGETEAVLWRLGKPPKYLGFLTNDKTLLRSSRATAINDDGVITGRASFSWDPVVTGEYPDPPTYPHLLGGTGHASEHAFRYDHGAMTDLNDLSFGTPVSPDHPSGANKLSSSGSAINRIGAIVGTSAGGLSVQTLSSYWAIVSDFQHPVAFTDLGGPNDLNVTPAPNSEFASLAEAVGINDHGAIAGYGAGDGRSAFFLSAGALQLIDPGYSPVGYANFGYATGMNNLDHVVGNFGVLGISALWVNDSALSPAERTIDLDAIARTKRFASSRVAAINDRDQIVGSAEYEAVLWQNGDLIRLNERIGSSPSVHLLEATAIYNHGMIAANTGKRAVLLIPAGLAVDYNKDKIINENDYSKATQDKPFRFWLNNDHDITDSNGEDLSGAADSEDNVITSKRDLEDLARLDIYLPQFHDAILNGKIKIGLKWKIAAGSSGSPSIKIWRNLSPSGGLEYLTDDATAAQHLNLVNPGLIQGTETYIIPQQFWLDVGLSAQQPKGHLLFEAVTSGKGELVLVFQNDRGEQIGEGAPLWLDLRDVKTFYQRGKALPENIPAPNGDVVGPFTGPVSYVDDPISPELQFEADPNEIPKAVLFVHGWSVTYDDYTNFTETLFKRLWHQGYRGRFCSFRWDTLVVNEIFDISTSNGEYNRSEYRAWLYGESLKQFARAIKAERLSISLIGHSMGNIVCNSSLQKGLNVQNYVLMEAAVPAGCYDTTGGNGTGGANEYSRFWHAEIVEPTPDFDQSLNGELTKGYRGFLAGITGNVSRQVVNFHNSFDYALATGHKALGLLETNWEANEEDYKPDGSFATDWHYRYYPSRVVHKRATQEFTFFVGRFVTDTYEMKSFVARPRSKAIGAGEGTTDNPLATGPITTNVNMRTSYGFGREDFDHSGQFNRRIQQLDELYKRLFEIVK